LALRSPTSSALIDLNLPLSGLFHVGDHFTVFGTEAVVFVTHARFVKTRLDESPCLAI
jgi:uncharacterized membrane protein